MPVQFAETLAAPGSVKDGGPLSHFRRMLPRQILSADREAMQFQRTREKRWAVRASSEIWPNDEQRIIALVADVDLEPHITTDPLTGDKIAISVAASSWLDADCAPPNFVVVRKATLRAHLVWLLQDPIFVATQPNAPRYARAIQSALGRAVGAADVHGIIASMHNPWSDDHEVREIHGRCYRLDELAAGLDLVPVWTGVRAALEDDPDVVITGMRNDTIFRLVLHRAPRIMGRCQTAESYEAALEAEACRLHARCEGNLESHEIPTMLKWIVSRRPFIRRDRAAELKAKRHAEGRSREAYVAPTRERVLEAVRLRALGWTIKKIADQLGVGIRAIHRYLRRAFEVIGVIPIRDNTSLNAMETGRVGGTRDSMSGAEWLDEVSHRVVIKLANVEQFRAAPDTLTLALGTRGVTVHDDGEVVWLAPSFAAGGTIASRLQDRVQHLDVQQYGINEATIEVAVNAVVGHLRE